MSVRVGLQQLTEHWIILNLPSLNVLLLLFQNLEVFPFYDNI